MDWLLANPQINSTFGSLGSYVDDDYLVNDDCLRTLEEIICKLASEDSVLRTFRRAIGFGQNVKNDIIPLLVNAKDSKIIDTTIRLLVNLTVPIECLLSVESISQSEIGRHTIFELEKLLITSKEAFVEWNFTKTLIDYMNSVLVQNSKVSIENCSSINNCLLLLRNILHVPEGNAVGGPDPHSNPSTSHNTSFQNQILWNLFTQGIDKLLIRIMSGPQRAYWAITMAQLIALMYKDQHINALEKLLNSWIEMPITESSEDNESNTSLPLQSSGDCSPTLTSDPTSDSSDNGNNRETFLFHDNTERYSLTGSGKTPKSISNSPEEAEQLTRKGTEFTEPGILARAIQSHLMQSMKAGHGASSSAKHSCTSTQVAANPPSSINEFHEVKKCSVSSNISTGIQALQSSLQIQSEKNPSPLACPNPKSETPDCTPIVESASTIVSKSRPSTPVSPSSISDVKSSQPHPVKMNQSQVSQSETSDCGYGTQVEKESISTSSNEEDGPNSKPIHQKPPPNQKQRFNAANKQRHPTSIEDKKELRRRKLIKRGKSNIIQMKGLIHHAPSDDDISHILKEFTVDFLFKAFNYLVEDVHAQLLTDLQVEIDTSHFFWLVTYFLKFAVLLEVDMCHVTCVLSFEIISCLTYEGVILCEQLEQFGQNPHSKLTPRLRRIHLVVTAIREFLKALDAYKKNPHLSKEVRENLALLQIQISQTEELRCLFVLLLRCFNPLIQSRQYLQDLIVTNHLFLVLLDDTGKPKTGNAVNMSNHIMQFATVEIMHLYGTLLADFRGNGTFVNDCIFTMMHHVGGDLGQINVLFQPSILKTFSQIWETEMELCDDWFDLIECVIHKFVNKPQPSPLSLTNTLPEISSQLLSGSRPSPWTQEEQTSLQWYYVQCKQSKCLVADIWKLFQENGNLQKTRVSIIEQLWEQDIITLTQYDDLMKVENPHYERNVQTPAFSVASGNSGKRVDENMTSPAVDDIQVLRDRLLKENKGNMIVWLQKSLLDCCYVKLRLLGISSEDSIDGNEQNNAVTMEPISYHSILKKKSIPVVPWNQEQFTVLSYQPFVLLLHKLGFHLDVDVKKAFVRIPEFWTADILYRTALKLGPLEESITKFDLKYLKNALSLEHPTNIDVCPLAEISLDSINSLARSNMSNSADRFASDLSSSWLRVVMSTNSAESKRAMEISRPSTATDAANATQPHGETSLKSPTHTRLKHDLTVIVEASGSELPVDVDGEDDELDHSDGPCLEEHDVVSACETASVASDLMYVSDEDEKHDIVPLIQ